MASPFAPGPSGIRMATAVSTAAASVHVGTNQLRCRRRRSPSAGELPGDGVRVEAATSTSICDLSSSADHGLDHNRCADQSNRKPLIGNVPVGSERQTSWSTRPVRRSNPSCRVAPELDVDQCSVWAPRDWLETATSTSVPRGIGPGRNRRVGKPQCIERGSRPSAGRIGNAVDDPAREEPIGHDQDGEADPDDGDALMRGVGAPT